MTTIFSTKTSIMALVASLVFVLVTSAFAAIITEAQAKNAISSFRDKGTWGEIQSEGKRQGNGGSGGGTCGTCE